MYFDAALLFLMIIRKLQLARYSWTLLQNEAEYDTNIQSLVKAMREEVESQDKENETEVKKES